MKKLICILSVCAFITACGNSPTNTNGTDTTKAADTSIHTDTTNMMTDTTHKDSIH